MRLRTLLLIALVLAAASLALLLIGELTLPLLIILGAVGAVVVMIALPMRRLTGAVSAGALARPSEPASATPDGTSAQLARLAKLSAAISAEGATVVQAAPDKPAPGAEPSGALEEHKQRTSRSLRALDKRIETLRRDLHNFMQGVDAEAGARSEAVDGRLAQVETQLGELREAISQLTGDQRRLTDAVYALKLSGLAAAPTSGDRADGAEPLARSS